MSTTPRILVLTLESGENEFAACKASVAEQTLPVRAHRVISGLGNVEAHRALYGEIMARAAEFDLFLKLDADMVLNRPTACEEIARLFATTPDLDHLEVRVFDHFTAGYIHGVHVFSPQVRWGATPGDALFVDSRPERPGRYLLDPEGLAPFVEHAPDPSDFQAFHFGYHRALKAYQPGRAVKSYGAMPHHLRTLERVEAAFEATGRRACGLALLAAELVLSGVLGGTSGEKHDPAVRAAFERVATLERAELTLEIAQARRRPSRRRLLWQSVHRPLLRASAGLGALLRG